MTVHELLAQQQQQAHLEQFQQWAENVNDNLSALIAIVIQLADLDEQGYKAIVIRCRAMKDQVCAQMRDDEQAAGQAAEPR